VDASPTDQELRAFVESHACRTSTSNCVSRRSSTRQSASIGTCGFCSTARDTASTFPSRRSVGCASVLSSETAASAQIRAYVARRLLKEMDLGRLAHRLAHEPQKVLQIANACDRLESRYPSMAD
jgi:hypothetical protein